MYVCQGEEFSSEYTNHFNSAGPVTATQTATTDPETNNRALIIGPAVGASPIPSLHCYSCTR